MKVWTKRRRAAHRALLCSVTGGLAWLCCAQVFAAPSSDWESPQRIRDAAADHAKSVLGGAGDVTVEVVSVDDRLRLPRCDGPLAVASPRTLDMRGGTLTVSCASPTSWRLFVPVRVAVETSVVVARRNISRGETLSAADLAVVTRRSSSLPYDYLTRIDQAVGLTVRRPLSEAAVVVPAALDRPELVARGSLVTLIARRGGIEVKSEGLAVQSAGLNERVRIRSRGGRIVEGLVEGESLVRVGP